MLQWQISKSSNTAVLEVLAFCDRDDLTFFNDITVLAFLVRKKVQWSFREKNLQVKSRPRSRPRILRSLNSYVRIIFRLPLRNIFSKLACVLFMDEFSKFRLKITYQSIRIVQFSRRQASTVSFSIYVMERQMVQNSRSKIVFTFDKFFIKVKRDFNQANQNQITFNGFSFKVTAYFKQAQQQKLTHSTNFNSTPIESCVKLKK